MANSNAQEVYDWLRRAGLSAAAALGVIGNLRQESGLRPTASGDGDTSYGIAQWHNERKTQLFTWSKNHGLDPSTLNAQKRFLVADLQARTSLWDKLLRTNDTTEAARLVMVDYERPKDTSDAALAKRVSLAMSAGVKDTPMGSGVVNTTTTPLNVSGLLGNDNSGTATATTGSDVYNEAWNDHLLPDWATNIIPGLPDLQKWISPLVFKTLAVGLGVVLVGVGVVKVASPAAGKILGQAPGPVGAAAKAAT